MIHPVMVQASPRLSADLERGCRDGMWRETPVHGGSVLWYRSSVEQDHETREGKCSGGQREAAAEGVMKRVGLMLAVALTVASILSGCVVVPAEEWHHEGYRYHHYHHGW